MARPNVSVQVVDNSFVVAGSEAGGPHISGMYSANGLITAFGVTLEKNDNLMTVESVTDWIGRLNGTTFGGTAGVGPTGAWKTEWYSAYNYLLYGGVLKIADTNSRLYDESIALDSVFACELTSTQNTFVSNTVASRSDIVGVVGVTYDGYVSGTATGATLYPSFTSSSSQVIIVGGEKLSLGLSNTQPANQYFVTVPLTADVAGCLARTDRDAKPWFSPAGTKRGRVLNIVRLIKNPSTTEQDSLYGNKINSVIGIGGQGVFLFGDKTFESNDSSSLTRVNVVRLINYIKKILGATARDLLFEINDPATRALFTNAAIGFLQSVKDGRGLYDYKVVCDETNNTPAAIDSNQFVADIYIKPTKSINFVKLTITNLNLNATL